jgi:PAS domain S-box-containing protein
MDRLNKISDYLDAAPALWRYALAIALGALATLLRASMNSIWGDNFAYVFAFPATLLVSLLAGFKPGLTATAVCFAGVWFAVRNLNTPAGLVGQSLFAAVDGLMVYITSEYRAGAQQMARQAELQRRAAAYARGLIEASLDPLATISAEGKIADVNEATVQATGVPRAMLIGSDFSAYFTEPDKAQAGYQEAFSTGFVRDYPLTLRHASGKVTDVVYNAIVYRGENGEAAGIFAAARDVTGFKRAEAEMAAQSKQLRAANGELDAFCYAVSHDLRAPLRALMGFSEALEQDYGDRLDGEARVYLDQIVIASRHMGKLIDALLTLSRSTRGELKRETLDISAMTERLKAAQAATEPDRKVAWSVEPDMRANGDAVMIEVVMRNLIDNAWKYTGKSPDPAIRVYAKETEGQRWFCVSDNGAGFDMAHANKLFNPFRRLHRQEEFPGVGIGLATVQRIVQRHGGEISGEGAPGKGARFCFTLPDQVSSIEETA